MQRGVHAFLSMRHHLELVLVHFSPAPPPFSPEGMQPRFAAASAADYVHKAQSATVVLHCICLRYIHAAAAAAGCL